MIKTTINSSQYRKLDMTLKSYSMVQTIQGITRIAKRGDKYTQSTIDVIFTNCYSDFVKSVVLDDRIGDHQAIKCELTFKAPKAPKFEKVEIRDYCKPNINRFVQFLSEGSDYQPLLDCNCVESATLGLSEHITSAYENCFPIKVIKRHEKFIHKPSTELLNAIKNTKAAHSSFKKLKNVRDKGKCKQCKSCSKCVKCDEAWMKYKSQRNHRTKMAISCRQANIVKDLKTKSMKNDLKGIWKTIKLASNMNPNVCSDAVTGESSSPESFNNHFAEIGLKIQAEALKFDGHVSYSDFLPQRLSESRFDEFEEVTTGEIISFVESLSNDKAIFDDVPLWILKIATSSFVEPLAHIVNLSLKTRSNDKIHLGPRGISLYVSLMKRHVFQSMKTGQISRTTTGVSTTDRSLEDHVT